MMGNVRNFEDYRNKQEYYNDGNTIKRKRTSYLEDDQSEDTIRKQSLNGNRARKRSAYIKVDKAAWDIFRKKVVPVVIAASIGLGAVGATGINNFIEDHRYASEIVELNDNYFNQYVGEFAHRCDHPSEGYYYDYTKLADGIKSYGNAYEVNGYSTPDEAIDEAIYFTEQRIDSKQTAIVLEKLGYDNNDGKTFTGYLEDNGYDDQNDYEESMYEQISNRLEIQEKKNELNTMLQEHSDSTTLEIANSIGGK